MKFRNMPSLPNMQTSPTRTSANFGVAQKPPMPLIANQKPQVKNKQDKFPKKDFKITKKNGKVERA